MLHLWVNKRLLVTDRGFAEPPGSGPMQRWPQADGTEVALIAKGDAFDIYLGSKTGVYNLTLTPNVAVSMAWWLLMWWFRQWFGLKQVLWRWSLGKILDSKVGK